MKASFEKTKPFFRKINATRAIEWYESLDLSAEGLIDEMNRAGV
jgi:hypothetical protein